MGASLLYMSCSEYKYYIHLSCFNLPPCLPSLPLHQLDDGHELVLKFCPKHKPWHFREFLCRVCAFYTNGLFYACSKCSFKADVKCASLPHTIHHAAHPRHLINLLTRYSMIFRIASRGASVMPAAATHSWSTLSVTQLTCTMSCAAYTN